MASDNERINFVVTGKTIDTLNELQRGFGCSSRTGTLRRCIAIAKLAMDMRRDDDTISLVGKDGVTRDVVLNA